MSLKVVYAYGQNVVSPQEGVVVSQELAKEPQPLDPNYDITDLPEGLTFSQPLPLELYTPCTKESKAIALTDFLTEGGTHGAARVYCQYLDSETIQQTVPIHPWFLPVFEEDDPRPQWIVSCHHNGKFAVQLETYPECTPVELYFQVLDRDQTTFFFSRLIRGGCVMRHSTAEEVHFGWA
jgi:hypothetical protein